MNVEMELVNKLNEAETLQSDFFKHYVYFIKLTIVTLLINWNVNYNMLL